MATKAHDDFDDFDLVDKYDETEYFDSHEEHRRARKVKKERVRKELDHRMDMRRLREMLDGYDVNDFDAD